MNKGKIIINRNILGLILTLFICIYAFASEYVIASSGEEKEDEPVKYKQTVQWVNHTFLIDKEKSEHYYHKSFGQREYYVAEGEVFTYTFPKWIKGAGTYETEKAWLNGEELADLTSISYVVTGENTIKYYAYDDYDEYTISYDDIDDKYKVFESYRFSSKRCEPITWRIDLNKASGYKVVRIVYCKEEFPVQEEIVTDYMGSFMMKVYLKKVKAEDKTAPEINAGDVFFPLNAANRGMLTYNYLLNLFSASDNFDGALPGQMEGAESGYYIEGYNENMFLSASGETVIPIAIVAVDKAGNKEEKIVNCYIIDTSPRHRGEGRKKAYRFSNC